MAWWPFGKKKKEEEEMIEDQNFRVSDDDIDFSLFRRNDEAAPAKAEAAQPATAESYESADVREDRKEEKWVNGIFSVLAVD